jgi:hypothetical protein
VSHIPVVDHPIGVVELLLEQSSDTFFSLRSPSMVSEPVTHFLVSPQLDDRDQGSAHQQEPQGRPMAKDHPGDDPGER